MPSVRKKQPAPFKIIDRDVAIPAMEIYAYKLKRKTGLTDFLTLRERFKALRNYDETDAKLESEFKKKYYQPYEEIRLYRK